MLKRWKNPFRQENCGAGHIHLRDRFLAIIERERLRALRNGSSFSLLVFDAEDGGEERPFAPFVKYLKTRLRSTDEIGWSADRRLGIMLPDTDAFGALAVARDITPHMGPGISLTEVKVHSSRKRLEKGPLPTETAPEGLVRYEIMKAAVVRDGRSASSGGAEITPRAHWAERRDAAGAVLG